MKKIMLVVGHKQTKKGAGNWTGMNEWDINKKMVSEIYYRIRDKFSGIASILMGIRTGSYTDMVDRLECDLAIEFHHNAGGGEGTEMLIQRQPFNEINDRTRIATDLSVQISDAVGVRNRGLKQRDPWSRGYYFLKNPKSGLSIIAETCFIDNISDMAQFLMHYEEVVAAYSEWIEYFIMDRL